MEQQSKRIFFSNSTKAKILTKTNGRCAHCGKNLAVETMTVEHILPLSKGGLNDEYNMTALCNDCNFKKSNSIYNVMDYYPYIAKEFLFNYINYHYYALNQVRPDCLTKDEVRVITGKSPEYIRLQLKMKKRGVPDTKIKQTLKKLEVKYILSKAYEGDTSDIFRIIQKSIDSRNTFVSRTVYSNEYELINDIRAGDAFVLRTNGKICGAFIFRKIYIQELNSVQLENIIEETGFCITHVMTLAVLDPVLCITDDIFQNIINYFFYEFLDKKRIPVYFNVLNMHINTSALEYISLPYKINQTNGTLDFFTIDSIRKQIKWRIQYTFKNSITEDEADVLTDYILRFDNRKNEDNKNLNELLLKLNTNADFFTSDMSAYYNRGI